MSARIVFDLDGTLIDSAHDIQAMANASLKALGAAPLTMDETRSFIGKGIDAFVQRMRAARDIPGDAHDDLLSDMSARYETAVALTRPYPGVLSALEMLRQNHRLGICTNKLTRPCIAVLKHLSLDPYFASVWGGDNPIARKPDPRPLMAAFEELGDGPKIFVGDSEVDAETARRAGVSFLLFTNGYRHSEIEDIPHCRHFSDFRSLPAIVDDLLPKD